MAWITEHCKEFLHFFGYAKTPSNPENPTGFFEYDGSDDNLTRKENGYKIQNQGMIDWVSQLTDADLEQFQYLLSDPAKEVPLMDYDNSVKATAAINNYYEKKFYGEAHEHVD